MEKIRFVVKQVETFKIFDNYTQTFWSDGWTVDWDGDIHEAIRYSSKLNNLNDNCQVQILRGNFPAFKKNRF